MKRAYLEVLKEAGLSPAEIEAIKAAFRIRKKASVSAEACLACGQKPDRLDYVCGACSRLKARSPRRFWHYVRDREEGGPGRLE
jgi:hypothetical protein